LTDSGIFVITNEEITEDLVGETRTFPKYTTQILNLCNQNAQGTRPSVVGQMSNLVQECPYRTYREWREWYLSKKPNAISEATLRIKNMVNNLRTALALIDDNMIKFWVEDLVIAKSFTGIHFQQAILSRVAKMRRTTFRMARPEEESKGIDGYLGQDKVSIKPETYRSKLGLPESIRIPIIYYEKLKEGIRVDASSILPSDGKLS
jgi:hypothetical protein